MADQNRLNEAIKYAVDCHAGQCRKGSHRPYILHPLEVLTILNALGADEALLIAGLLHDVLEDTAATEADLRSRFGDDVADLVCAHTEDKRKTWQERKSAAIEEVRRGSHRLACLILADKLANLRSMARDFELVGDALWDRFNAPKERQAWYYGQMLEALAPHCTTARMQSCLQELQAIYHNIF